MARFNRRPIVERDGSKVAFGIGQLTKIQLGSVPTTSSTPEGFEVELRDFSVGGFEVSWSGKLRSIGLVMAPSGEGMTTIKLSGEAHSVFLSSGSTQTLTREVRLVNESQARMPVVNANQLWSLSIRAMPQHVELSDSGLLSVASNDVSLSVSGSCQVNIARCDSLLVLSPRTSLDATKGNGLSVERLDFAEGVSHSERILKLGGVVVVRTEATDVGVSLSDGARVVIGEGAVAARCAFSGAGAVRVEGWLGDSRVSGKCSLDIGPNGTATEIFGDFGTLQAADRSYVLGGYRRLQDGSYQGLRPTSLGDLENSVIEDLDVTGLWLWDLEKLAKAERLSIATPDKRKEMIHMAERIQSPHGLAGGDPSTSRAFFWRRLSDIVADKHGSGEGQSRVRYIANEMRLGSPAISKRERSLLNLYKLVGYGESIGRPLYLFLSACALLAAAVSVDCLLPDAFCSPLFQDVELTEALDPLEGLIRLVVSPLAFFRFVDGPYAASDWTSLMLVGLRIVGVLMIFFSLAAVRRVAKAE